MFLRKRKQSENFPGQHRLATSDGYDTIFFVTKREDFLATRWWLGVGTPSGVYDIACATRLRTIRKVAFELLNDRTFDPNHYALGYRAECPEAVEYFESVRTKVRGRIKQIEEA